MDNTNGPIGIFDSGFGGLTIARAISHHFPHESLIYVGDTERCPYGCRDQDEVRLFVQQIGIWLERSGAKLIVIACNTATAAGLYALENSLSVPVIGVVESGAQAAIEATRLRRVGVLATRATVNSGAYIHAIKALDASVRIVQCPAQRLVEVVERRVMLRADPELEITSGKKLFDTPEIKTEVQRYVTPLISADVDTVVLGCTHFSFLFSQIREELGDGVRIVSSAEKVCQQIAALLEHCGGLAPPDHKPRYQFATTSHNRVGFASGVRFVFGNLTGLVTHIDLATLEALGK